LLWQDDLNFTARGSIMRLISYNILDGGEGRADPLAEVIEAQRPDVVALVEATDLSVIERMARRFNFDYVQALGRDQGSGLLTRWTIRDSTNHALLRPELTKSLLEATLIDPTGTQWSVGVVHLRHHALEECERVRECELAVVLDVFAAHRKEARPHIICGDFNADSPVAKIEPAKCKESTQKAWEANGSGIPRRVIATMLAHGYVDTLHAVRPEFAETAGTFTTQTPGQRVDYIFTHGIDPSRLTDAWIEYDRLAKYASDHFPVGVEVD
jgi:endonuclease/exonuclease/phosphatase family metal-dependent hydrolase